MTQDATADASLRVHVVRPFIFPSTHHHLHPTQPQAVVSSHIQGSSPAHIPAYIAMPPRFGVAAPKCARCDKSVYAAEQVVGPLGKPYHKTCLVCSVCRKRLDSTLLLEHDGEAYCKNCHRAHLGQGKGGFGLAVPLAPAVPPPEPQLPSSDRSLELPHIHPAVAADAARESARSSAYTQPQSYQREEEAEDATLDLADHFAPIRISARPTPAAPSSASRYTAPAPASASPPQPAQVSEAIRTPVRSIDEAVSSGATIPTPISRLAAARARGAGPGHAASSSPAPAPAAPPPTPASQPALPPRPAAAARAPSPPPTPEYVPPATIGRVSIPTSAPSTPSSHIGGNGRLPPPSRVTPARSTPGKTAPTWTPPSAAASGLVGEGDSPGRGVRSLGLSSAVRGTGTPLCARCSKAVCELASLGRERADVVWRAYMRIIPRFTPNHEPH